MTLVFSLWDDPMSGMEWLDSTTDGPPRGSCPVGSGDAATLRQKYPNAKVTYTNLKWGPIGSTQSVYPDDPTPTPPAPPTPGPPSPIPGPPTPPPTPSSCPGGSLSACIALCPQGAAYQPCVQTCLD